MNQNLEQEIALRDRAIELLEKEVKAKNELIENQKVMIAELEKYNNKLKELMHQILNA